MRYNNEIIKLIASSLSQNYSPRNLHLCTETNVYIPNRKLACEYLVKQSRVTQNSMNLSVSLINYHFFISAFSKYPSFNFQKNSFMFILDLNLNWFSGRWLIVVFLCVTEVLTHIIQNYALNDHHVSEITLHAFTVWEIYTFFTKQMMYHLELFNIWIYFSVTYLNTLWLTIMEFFLIS